MVSMARPLLADPDFVIKVHVPLRLEDLGLVERLTGTGRLRKVAKMRSTRALHATKHVWIIPSRGSELLA
jgi:2,4-dienoyl-CoA reductase-like NADH-dependent reductase (Old Yellow Enzyme family)